MTGNTRPTIGIMTGSFHTDYSRTLIEALTEALKDIATVVLYQGFDASRFLELGPYVNEGFDQHYYSRFEYAKFLPADMLIISFGTISAVPNAMPLKSFLEHLPPVPVILIEDETLLENGTYITVDNYAGMRQLVHHLITDHKYRRILYVSGPKKVHDCSERLRAYRETMAAAGLPLSEDMIVYGDFSDLVDGLIEELLDRFPDAEAIVCANDEMAESAYRVLKKRGLRPGTDVAVTGFDDNTSAAFMTPSLTTVRQCQDELAAEAAKMAKQILRGVLPAPVTLPARMVCRQSCGCAPYEDQASDECAGFINVRQEKKQLTRENMLSTLLLRNLLRKDITMADFFLHLGNSLQHLNTARAWVALLDEPLCVKDTLPMFLPSHLKLHMRQDSESVTSFSQEDAPTILAFDPEVTLNLSHPETSCVMAFPLFYGNLHYGIFLAEAKIGDQFFYHALSLEIGTGLRYLYLALEQQKTRADLMEKNTILDFSASHDPLTGLYNRAGIMSNLYGFIRQNGLDRQYSVVMADLDRLKEINDTLGHSAGDIAIKTAAELLGAALPAESPLGRSGGDEFIAIFLADETSPEDIHLRLDELCRSCDDERGYSFFVGVSIGCQVFPGRELEQIPQFLKMADGALYEDKKNRRRSVIRNIIDKG